MTPPELADIVGTCGAPTRATQQQQQQKQQQNKNQLVCPKTLSSATQNAPLGPSEGRGDVELKKKTRNPNSNKANKQKTIRKKEWKNKVVDGGKKPPFLFFELHICSVTRVTLHTGLFFFLLFHHFGGSKHRLAGNNVFIFARCIIMIAFGTPAPALGPCVGGGGAEQTVGVCPLYFIKSHRGKKKRREKNHGNNL